MHWTNSNRYRWILEIVRINNILSYYITVVYFWQEKGKVFLTERSYLHINTKKYPTKHIKSILVDFGISAMLCTIYILSYIVVHCTTLYHIYELELISDKEKYDFLLSESSSVLKDQVDPAEHIRRIDAVGWFWRLQFLGLRRRHCTDKIENELPHSLHLLISGWWENATFGC